MACFGKFNVGFAKAPRSFERLSLGWTLVRGEENLDNDS